MDNEKPVSFWDRLEKKIIFKFSRTFFWVFTALAGLLIVISALSFLYSVVPPGKEKVVKQSYPVVPKVSYKEILNEITPKEMPKQEVATTRTASENNTYSQQETQIKPAKSQVEILLDSLSALFPNSWEGVFHNVETGKDIFGRVKGYQKVLTGEGAKYIVINYLYLFNSENEKIEELKEILKLIPSFNEGQRVEALRAYTSLSRRNRRTYQIQVRNIDYEYNQKLAEAETKFIQAKVKKEALESNSIKGLGTGIVAVSLIGLILSFLAIERNTRAIKILIEKGEKNAQT